jgi:hypothetical protein
MTTHVEHGTIHSAGFPLFSNLNAAIRAKFQAWRARQIERAQIEALEALGPEILDDIGVSIVKADKLPKSRALSHPYVIAVTAMCTPHPTERGEL